MASDDKIEELIREIAVKHGIAVGRDDPILILQTINTRLMQDSQAAQQEILDRFKEELEAIAHRWGDDAKGKAERTLNAALAASKEAMAKGMQDGGKAAVEAVRRELEAVAAQLAAPIREARRVSYMNIVAAGMAVFAAALALWASL
ncbi:TPA: conjugal transfer protein TraM [Stenotrophomonas maltophilia]|nr:conjugal transfer protein TraM [Stenotrophomonas maltophilia]HDS1594420.1 conjugal transfer protein TraM [Stenotrophomonas maltophilia]